MVLIEAATHYIGTLSKSIYSSNYSMFKTTFWEIVLFTSILYSRF